MSHLRDRLSKHLVVGRYTKDLVHWYAFHRSRLHVVSYPKSGRTWLRYALGVALQEHFGLQLTDASDLLEINRLARVDRSVPSIRFSHDDNPHTKEGSQLERDKRAYRSKHVVFLVRDPRDVVVSSYYQHTLRAPRFGDPAYEGTMADFIRHPVFGVETIVEFMNIWAQNRHVPRSFELIRYEDMTENLERELSRVLRVAGITDPRPSALERAVETATFENMRAMEQSDALGIGRLRPGDLADLNSFKVRRGRVGAFVEELTDLDRAHADRAIGELDPFFGYTGS